MYKSCCFTGHRPQRLYGYDLSNNKYQVLAHKLAKIAYTLYTKYDVDTFLLAVLLVPIRLLSLQ